jgi:ATP-dependent protease ClpP protease subunit
MLIHVGEIDNTFLAKLVADQPREIWLCSEGGFVSHMLAAIDLIQAQAIKVTAGGVVASAAVPIVAAGADRTALPSTRFMVHNPWTIIGDAEADSLKTEAEEMEICADAYFTLLGKYTKKPKSWWAKKCNSTPYYFSAAEAVKLGVLDAVQ